MFLKFKIAQVRDRVAKNRITNRLMKNKFPMYLSPTKIFMTIFNYNHNILATPESS